MTAKTPPQTRGKQLDDPPDFQLPPLELNHWRWWVPKAVGVEKKKGEWVLRYSRDRKRVDWRRAFAGHAMLREFITLDQVLQRIRERGSVREGRPLVAFAERYGTLAFTFDQRRPEPLRAWETWVRRFGGAVRLVLALRNGERDDEALEAVGDADFNDLAEAIEGIYEVDISEDANWRSGARTVLDGAATAWMRNPSASAPHWLVSETEVAPEGRRELGPLGWVFYLDAAHNGALRLSLGSEGGLGAHNNSVLQPLLLQLILMSANVDEHYGVCAHCRRVFVLARRRKPGVRVYCDAQACKKAGRAQNQRDFRRRRDARRRRARR